MTVMDMIKQLSSGMGITLEIFFVTLVTSLILGLALALIRMSKIRILSLLAKIYISIMRGTPLMLQLLVVYFGPYFIFGIQITRTYRLTAVLIGFSLNYAAYFAEIYRAGISAIPEGQYEAAKLLGYSKVQTFVHIIMPQVIKRIIPPVANETITLVKDTSLAFTLAVAEVFTLTKQLMEEAAITKKIVLIDLAVPRDIEPMVGILPNVTLYDIDSFKINNISPEMEASLEQAGKILAVQQEEFYNWYQGHDLIPRIHDIKKDAAADLTLRIKKTLQKTAMEEDDRKNLMDAIDTAAEKVVNKLLFGLRDCLEEEEFRNCVEGLEKLYEQ